MQLSDNNTMFLHILNMITENHNTLWQGWGNIMPDLSNLSHFPEDK